MMFPFRKRAATVLPMDCIIGTLTIPSQAKGLSAIKPFGNDDGTTHQHDGQEEDDDGCQHYVCFLSGVAIRQSDFHSGNTNAVRAIPHNADTPIGGDTFCLFEGNPRGNSGRPMDTLHDVIAEIRGAQFWCRVITHGVSFQEDGSDSAADRVALCRLSENPVKCRVFRKPPL
jgi:hypothetical protein